MSETYKDGRFFAGFQKSITEQDFLEETACARQGLTLESEAKLLARSTDPLFIRTQIDHKDRDIAGKLLNILDLANDDIYIAANKWAEQPEKLGEMAGQLVIEARWDKEHANPAAALSKYRRELRILKSCGFESSSTAEEAKKEIEALTCANAYFRISCDRAADLDAKFAKKH